MNFLFHKVSDSEKEEIKKEAKDIMDKFSKKLSSIDKKISEPLIERDEFEREERCSDKNEFKDLIEDKMDSDFRKRMLENAPQKNKDFIIAEKKKW